MRFKVKTLGVVLLASMILSSCNNSQAPVPASSGIDSFSTWEEEETNIVSYDSEIDNSSSITNDVDYAVEEVVEETQKELLKPIVLSKYTIKDIISDFSNGRAWVSYYGDDDKLCYGLIDINGFLLYSISGEKLKERGWQGTVAGETNCGQYNVLYPKDVSYSNRKIGFIIVDDSGKVSFDSDSKSEDSKYRYLGYGDGSFLICMNVSNFSENKSSFCEMKADGEIIYEEEIESFTYEKYQYPMEYCGDGFFQSTPFMVANLIYNKTNNVLYDLSSKFFFDNQGSKWSIELEIVDIIDNENVLLQDSSSSGGHYYFLNKDSLLDSSEVDVSDKIINLHNRFARYGEGLLNAEGASWVKGIYDYTGTLLYQYPDDLSINYTGSFSGGYALLFLIGADGKNYFTIVNSNGEMQYDPIQSDYATSYYMEKGQYIKNWNGYVYYEGNIVSPNGEEKDKNILLNELGDDFAEFMGYYCGLKKCNGYFEDINQNVLDTIFVIQNYDEVCNLKWNNNELKNLGEDDAIIGVEMSTPKNYQKIKNFSLYGKWKNIGVGTYGQAQKGAIIVFDGANCNFFSPNDTYAFYEEGDWYRLDCTSPLADTVSFTVKTVDENHADIIYNNGIVELERVE